MAIRLKAPYWGAILILVLLSASFLMAQVTIGPEDIPMEWGSTSCFYIETAEGDIGIEVEITPPGPDQEWDFLEGSTEEEIADSIINPATAPFIENFPDANRVVYGAVPYGLVEGSAYRYELVDETGWYILGFTVEYENTPIPIVLSDGLPLLELPMEYGDSWDQTLVMDYTIDASNIPLPIEADSIRFDVDLGGSSEVDGWGTAQFPGGQEDVLRVYTLLGGSVEATIIYYIFNIRFEIPIGEIFGLEDTHAYSWYAPGAGEIANISSFPAEPDPLFTEASMVRRRFDPQGPVSISLTPVNPPITIPAEGGSFQYEAVITNNTGNPGQGNVWTEVVLPNGTTYPLNNYNLTLQPNETLEYTPEQDVPGFAPPGEYVFVARVGIYPNYVVDQDEFGFEKLAGGAAYSSFNDWTAYGWGNEDEFISSSGAQPSEFAITEMYPNPFNPSTKVTVSLPGISQLRVCVFNSLGQEVALLADGTYTSGEHTFSFNAEGLAGGIYFIHATVPGKMSEMRKVVLMK